MAIVKQHGHQDVLCCVAEVAVDADLASAADAVLLELPGDAVIIGGSLLVDEAVAGMTTPTLAIDLKLAAGDEVLLGATAIDAAGATAITPYEGVTGEVVDVAVTAGGSGTPSAGKVYVEIQYVRTDRVTEVR